MTGSSGSYGFCGAVTVGVVLLNLLAGVASHLSRPAALGDAMRAHGLVPPGVVLWCARVVPLAEGVLVAAGGLSLLGGRRLGLTVTLAGAAGLFALYAGYARRVTAGGRGGPCGCSRTEVPMSGWVTLRAVVLGLLALAGALLVGLGAPRPTEPAAWATVLLAAPACAVLLWSLPAALHQPAEGAATP